MGCDGVGWGGVRWGAVSGGGGVGVLWQAILVPGLLPDHT